MDVKVRLCSGQAGHGIESNLAAGRTEEVNGRKYGGVGPAGGTVTRVTVIQSRESGGLHWRVVAERQRTEGI